ncbi:MAG: efflux RND transporter periplasmic adaptor subunit, partial [Caldilineaceae bacterium]|nr:efflux RND transporter periplasmic adaptor subunit [Caldilineaceae bacterium]
LSMATSGIVAEVLVDEGQMVAAGEPLVRLDAAQARAAVARAEADLQRSQANLDDLLDGNRVEDIAVAQAAVDAAQARLDKLVQSTDAGDLAASQAAVASANASLQKVLEGPSDQELIAAKADIANAEAALTQAQRAYDRVKWRNDVGATQESANLQTATNNYEAAKARYDDLLAGASQADINAANAQLWQANAQFEALRAGRPSDIASLEADVRSAKANLDKLLAGSTTSQITAAEADVKANTASLQQALISLSQTELRAPFNGLIAAVDINPGEQATPGAALVRLADTTAWRIETEDLTELQVVDVQVGDEATITFDALPGVEMVGTVTTIRPFGENSSGDIVYTVVLEPGAITSNTMESSAVQDRLRWNMTAVVSFAADQSAGRGDAVASGQ